MRIKKELTNKIGDVKQYESAINKIKYDYSRTTLIDDDNYSVKNLLEDIRVQSKSDCLEIDLEGIESVQDPRWAVLTLKFSNIIKHADSLESAADIIEENYIKSTSRDSIKVVSSADDYAASNVVNGLRNIDEFEIFKTITRRCGMREHAKETYDSESDSRDSDSSQQNRSSSANENSVDKDNKEQNRDSNRIYNERILDYINRRYERIKKQNEEPLISDFKYRVQEMVNKHGGDTIIYEYEDSDESYKLGWLNQRLGDIIENSVAPDGKKTRLNNTRNWSRWRDNITSTDNLREKIGELYIDKTTSESSETDQTNNFI